MTYVLGLTGSIGMGKSTTAAMFAEAGVPVWDADAVVRSLYDKGGAASVEIARLYPDAMTDGRVDRQKLRALISEDPAVLDHLQKLVHPLVAEDRASFIKSATGSLVVLDVPLLFETGADAVCDGVVVVSAPPEVQRDRVLARGEMTEAEFELILARQMPDTEKRKRADWVIETVTLDSARSAVEVVIAEIEEGQGHA